MDCRLSQIKGNRTYINSSLMSWKFEFMGEVTTTKKKIPMICNLVSLALVIVFIIKIPIQLYVPGHKL